MASRGRCHGISPGGRCRPLPPRLVGFVGLYMCPIEDSFWDAVATDPRDVSSLLAFSDWLREEGRPLEAEAWEYLGRWRKRPQSYDNYYWWMNDQYARSISGGYFTWYTLPGDWLDSMCDDSHTHRPYRSSLKVYLTYQTAYLAAVRGYLLLSDSDRKSLHD